MVRWTHAAGVTDQECELECVTEGGIEENNGQKYYLGLLVLVGTYHRV